MTILTGSERTKEHCVEILCHQIAAGIHRMMFRRDIGFVSLCEKCVAINPKLTADFLRRALVGDCGDMKLNEMSDIAFVLDCEWEVQAMMRNTDPPKVFAPYGEVVPTP